MAGEMDDEKLKQSEAKRSEALHRIESARRHQDDNDTEASQHEITNAWFALDEALEICPTNNRARLLLVSCAMNRGDYARAKSESVFMYESFTKEQLAGMGDSVLHLSIAHASKMLDEMDDAIRYSAEATQLYPHDPQAYMVLGELYEAIGNNPEAERYCREALSRNDSPQCKNQLNQQNVVFTLCCLTSCLVRQAQFERAEEFAQKAIEIDPHSTLAYRHLADVYHFQRRYDDALKACQHFIALDPDDEEVHLKMDAIKADQAHAAASVDGGASLPRRQRDAPNREQPIPEDALSEPPAANMDNQSAARSIPREGDSRQGSLHRKYREEDGAISVKSHGSRLSGRSGRQSAKKEEKDKGSSWSFCCMERNPR